MKSVLVFAIRLYQRYLSPHKGFCCAHAYVHGGSSCSQAVIDILNEQGVYGSYHSIRQRFQDCKQAYLSVKRKKSKKRSKSSQNKASKRNRDNDACDCVPLECLPSPSTKSEACDCLPCGFGS